MGLCESTFGRYSGAPVLALRGHEPHPLGHNSARESPDRMANQPVAFMSSFSEAPSGRLSRLRTLAALLPSRALAAGLACSAAFWLLGRRSAKAAFLSRPWLAGRDTALVWHNVGAFGGFRRLHYGGDWRIGLFFGVRRHGQSPGTAKCRIQGIHPSAVAARQATPATKPSQSR